jgi:hypothetical protein
MDEDLKACLYSFFKILDERDSERAKYNTQKLEEYLTMNGFDLQCVSKKFKDYSYLHEEGDEN